jgi:hypothetical protein
VTRIYGIDPEQADDDIQRALSMQERRWGRPFQSHLIYARRPSIYRGARGMWRGLDESGLLGGALHALINRRVALINHCAF